MKNERMKVTKSFKLLKTVEREDWKSDIIENFYCNDCKIPIIRQYYDSMDNGHSFKKRYKYDMEILNYGVTFSTVDKISSIWFES
jgi:hypothetical protein